jgi:methyl-accepting chemotaxis protein
MTNTPNPRPPVPHNPRPTGELRQALQRIDEEFPMPQKTVEKGVVHFAPKREMTDIGRLASDTIRKVGEETAASVEALGDEVKKKMLSLAQDFRDMSDEDQRLRESVEAQAKSTLDMLSSVSHVIRDNAETRARLVAEMTEICRRVETTCKSVSREFTHGPEPQN